MPDMEKIIKGLECCKWSRQNVKPEKEKCDECPYKDKSIMNAFTVWRSCTNVLAEDALALLKEQEPKTGKWILDDEDANSWECSECGGLLIINDGTPHENDWHFCPYCGAKLDKQEMK